ncbi:MAG TPA: hypothetical protein VGV10_07965 [Thermoleophilaceae bacterium]|nr:hypothetical protein [Thermoleophilaceae bacterium]
MTTRAAALAAACALSLAVAGCGAEGKSEAGGAAPDPNDKRAVALACIRDEQGLEARLSGEKAIQVDGPGGARIEFLLSSGEAEGRQFLGGAQNAEQIGSALLFVNQAGEEQLTKVETCLEDQ